jgi:hypothetical protein
VNREQMVEAIHAKVYDATIVEARAALDAILPQVTTVAELEALHDEAGLLTGDGRFYRAYMARLAPLHQDAHLTFPLTVVWQPS